MKWTDITEQKLQFWHLTFMILTFAQHGSINSIQAANIWILSDIFVSYLFFFLQFIYWFIFDILNIVDGSRVQRTVVCGDQTFEKEAQTWSTFGRSEWSKSDQNLTLAVVSIAQGVCSCTEFIIRAPIVQKMSAWKLVFLTKCLPTLGIFPKAWSTQKICYFTNVFE